MFKSLCILVIVTVLMITSSQSARLAVAASEEVKTETTGGKCSCHCESPKIVRVEVPKIQIKYIPVVVKSLPEQHDPPPPQTIEPSRSSEKEARNDDKGSDQRIPGVYDTLAVSSSRRNSKTLGLEYF